MQKLLEASIFFRWLTALFRWIGVKWHQSCIVTWFLSPSNGTDISEHSFLAKIWRFLHRLLVRVFEILRLNKLFEGSIFKQLFIWCLLPAALAPVLPTMVLICLVLVGVFSLAVTYGSDKNHRLHFSPVNKYIGLFALVFLIATLTSVTVSGSLFTGMTTILFALFAIVLSNAITSKKQVDFAISIFVTVGTAVSLFGIYQYFFYNPGSAGAWIDNDLFSDITNRVYSTLENPNVLAEYLLLITPFSVASVFAAKTWPKRLFFLACTLAMLLCMVFTSSRGGWLGLIAAAAIFAVMLDGRFILLGLVGLVVLYFTLPDWVITRFTSIGDMADGSTSYRVSIWFGTLAMLKDYWFSGIGPGIDAFNLVYPAYSFNTISAPHAHNLFLQLICDAGIVGLAMFGAVLLSFYRTTVSAFSRERDKKSRMYLAAATASISGFLLQGMTDYSFYNNRVMLFFWVVIALGLVLARRSSMEEGHFLWSKS